MPARLLTITIKTQRNVGLLQIPTLLVLIQIQVLSAHAGVIIQVEQPFILFRGRINYAI